eukprot:4250228-Pleurochrysis_carterae.AAC.2
MPRNDLLEGVPNTEQHTRHQKVLADEETERFKRKIYGKGMDREKPLSRASLTCTEKSRGRALAERKARE